MSNLGWLFYKEYFRGLDYSNLESEANSRLIKERVDTLTKQTVTFDSSEMLGNTHFKATTTYPGLILGSGNAHELPSIEGQAILGFSFDYTTGLPIIAGSSIKGVLRSAFKHAEYIQELLNDDNFDVKALETEIFDNGDIFFDAVVVGAGTNLLGDDYLAPHGDDALKNPIPLRFIKVMPNVTFRFDFELQSTEILSKSKKSELFRAILEDLGLGAKTNVGYGKFSNFAKEQTEEEAENEAKEREEERLQELKKADNLEILEQFKRDFPDNREIDSLIISYKEQERKRDIERAFNNLDKNNKRYVDSFIKKYQDNEDAKEFIEQLKNSSKERGKSSKEIKIEDLNEVKDAKAFKKILHELQKSLNDEHKEIVKENTLRLTDGLNKRKRDKFLREINLKKYFDKDFEESLFAFKKSAKVEIEQLFEESSSRKYAPQSIEKIAIAKNKTEKRSIVTCVIRWFKELW